MQQSISQKIITQRFYSIFLNSLGEILKIHCISGDIIEGLLHSIDPIKNEYFIINNPRRLSRTGKQIFLKESKLKIYFNDISYIDYEINNFIPQPKNNFEIDSEISKKKYNKNKEEKLVKYKVNEEDKNIFSNQSLEDEINNKNNDENWDQFEVNKKKYNVISTYDENLYTTVLDKNKIPKELNDYADKIYNEIKNSSQNEKNIHILEDRGIIQEADGDINEEEKYSSVIKNNNNYKNKKKDNINKINNMNIDKFFNEKNDNNTKDNNNNFDCI